MSVASHLRQLRQRHEALWKKIIEQEGWTQSGRDDLPITATRIVVIGAGAGSSSCFSRQGRPFSGGP